MKEQTALFKPSVVAQLAQAARLAPVRGSHKKIAEKLSELARSFLLNRLWQIKPPPSEIAKRLRAIRSAAAELARKLPRPDETEVRYRLTAQAALKVSTPELTALDSGHERLRVASAMLGELVEWSRAAERRESARKGRKTGNKGDEATQALMNGLAEIWLEHWDRGPGTSRSFWVTSDTTYGPFVRFVQAFRDALKEKLGPADFAHDPGLRQALKLTPEGIRARARKTPVALLSKLGPGAYAACELPLKSEIQKT